MLRMGRPRLHHKDMPPGMRFVDGRWYWRPTNEATRLVLDRLSPGAKGIPAGEQNADADSARRWWANTIIPALAVAVPADLPAHGIVDEILERYERLVVPTLTPGVQDEQRRYIKTLRAKFGAMLYAKSEAEAATGKYLRAMHLTQYLDEQARAGRPVAANREVQALSRMFHIAKARWGLTEYNPCLQVEYNEERPRDAYQTDADFMAVYVKAQPLLQVMMDIAQMTGKRRGMQLQLNLADIAEEGIWFTLNKKKRNAPTRRTLVRWTNELRDVVNRAIELRKAARGGQKNVDDLATAPLFLNRLGKRVSKTGFNSMWHRAARGAGYTAHQFHFHDLRAKTASDAPDEKRAQDLLDHQDPRTTRTVYRRKPSEVIPLHRVSKKTS